MQFQRQTEFISLTSKRGLRQKMLNGEDGLDDNGPELEELVPERRIKSHRATQFGILKAPRMGVFVLRFDNSYSRLRRKCLTFRCEVAEGPSPPMRWLVLQQQSVADQEARQLRIAQASAKLMAYYGRVNPEKQSQAAVKAVIEAYEGRLDELNKQLTEKYGTSPKL